MQKKLTYNFLGVWMFNLLCVQCGKHKDVVQSCRTKMLHIESGLSKQNISFLKQIKHLILKLTILGKPVKTFLKNK